MLVEVRKACRTGPEQVAGLCVFVGSYPFVIEGMREVQFVGPVVSGVRDRRFGVVPLVVAVCLLAALIAAAAAGASPSPSGVVDVRAAQPRAVFFARGKVVRLAANGNRVAALTTHIANSNDRILVWTAPGSRFTRINTHVNSANPSTGFAYVNQLALGGGSVAWVEAAGGNYTEGNVYAAPIAGGPTKSFDFYSNGPAGDPAGDHVGQLFGQGPLLFYNRWSNCRYTGDPDQDDPGCPVGGQISGEKLLRISAGLRTVVTSGPGAFRLAAVGGGRLALVATAQQAWSGQWIGSNVVTVTTPAGALVATVPAVAGDPPRAVVLSATHLLVERALTIDSYNPSTGALLASIPRGTPASLKLVGVNASMALLLGPRRLDLVRLSDNSRITLPLPAAALACACPTDAKLTDAGLFYAYNVPTATAKGRIVFVPTARLLARF